MTHPIQIAGIHDQAEAKLLVDAGVEYLGFPLRLSHHREDLTEAEASAIIRALPPTARGVLITYLSEPDAVLSLCDAIGAGCVQLHGEITLDALLLLKKKRPSLFVIKSLIVAHENFDTLASTIKSVAPAVDAFLTDTFDPATGATGATGKTHDWAVSKKIVSLSPVPVLLAGGLTPENVAKAIETVRPWGVDSHTGVEGPDGRKDAVKVSRFVAEARRAFARVGP